MDALNGVCSPGARGHPQDALGHLGDPAGFLVVFRLSFIARPLLTEAILGRVSEHHSLPNLLFINA